jgi:RNA polymerase sigma-70 factor (ECF subfamily)
MIPSYLRSNRESGAVESDLPDSSPGSQVTTEERAATLGEIARHHHSSLVRFLALRTGSAEDAKEIVQEAYAKVLALDRPQPFSLRVGFLWKIAANLAIDRKRQRAAQSRLASIALAPVCACGPSTETVVEQRERLAIVQKAIAQLPPRCRQAFLLRIVEGQRFSFVSREMGITERMAKVHVARAMEYLHACVSAAEGVRALT